MLERVHSSPRPFETSLTSIRSILFHVHDDDELVSRLETALSLARASSAHLQCLQLVPVDAYTTIDAFKSFVSGQAIAMLEDEAAKVRERVEARLADAQVDWSFDTRTAPLVPELLRSAALADVLIIGREPQNAEFGRTGRSLLAEILCKSRTPLFIPGTALEPFDPFGTLVIAWNGSIEAANTIRQAIGLIKAASKVRVIRIAERKATRFPDTRILEYLSRHGVHPELEVHSVRRDFTGDLIEYVGASSASCLVMGGYSHSRASEFFFGGVTRELLRDFPVPLVMAH